MIDNFEHDLPDELSEFFRNNPESGYEKRKGDGYIVKPWGDTTLELKIAVEDTNAIQILNSIYLPPDLTAIWHTDTNDLEVIYTAYPVSEAERNRKFEFQFNEKTHLCEFCSSSARLLGIAKMFRPTEPPVSTEHRNLFSYSNYIHHCTERPDSLLAKEGSPISFWIRDIKWEEGILDLIRNLNFYMSYFDRATPMIVIHERRTEETSSLKFARFKDDTFPTIIRGNQIDSFLLSLWSSSITNDPFLKFLYSYQILEYMSYYYLKDRTSREVRRTLKAPHVLSDIDKASCQIIDIVGADNMADTQKFEHLIETYVNPEVLWKDIEINLDFFAEETLFEGGYKIKPMARESWTYEDFKTNWSSTFPKELRQLRNVLVHSKETKAPNSITPSEANYSKLYPWARLAHTAALEVLVYKQF